VSVIERRSCCVVLYSANRNIILHGILVLYYGIKIGNHSVICSPYKHRTLYRSACQRGTEWNKKTGNVRINVTLTGVRVAIVAVEKQ
jgi:hypothetical protein